MRLFKFIDPRDVLVYVLEGGLVDLAEFCEGYGVGGFDCFVANKGGPGVIEVSVKSGDFLLRRVELGTEFSDRSHNSEVVFELFLDEGLQCRHTGVSAGERELREGLQHERWEDNGWCENGALGGSVGVSGGSRQDESGRDGEFVLGRGGSGVAVKGRYYELRTLGGGKGRMCVVVFRAVMGVVVMGLGVKGVGVQAGGEGVRSGRVRFVSFFLAEVGGECASGGEGFVGVVGGWCGGELV